MTIEYTEMIWMNETSVCSLDELAETSGLSRSELEDLVANGAIVPAAKAQAQATGEQAPIQGDDQRLFPLQHVIIARRARRLRDDFELDAHGMAVAMRLLNRITELESELLHAQARRGQRR